MAQLSCTDCHGGDDTAFEKERAHVLPPEGVSQVKGAPTDVLDRLPAEYTRFINPGDYRVAEVGCGPGNPASGTTGCHADEVEAAPRSVMSTFVGHYNVPRFLAGVQTDKEAHFGAHAIEDPNYDSSVEGTVPSIETLRPPEPEQDRGTVETLMDNYLAKSCTHCHSWSYGFNDAPGNYRSSGCSSCHMVYNNDGISRSEDPTVDKSRPSHPERHELTTAIPIYNCEHCHFQGARIGLLYQGIREHGFSEPLPPNAQTLGVALHDHGPDYYVVDEDITNDVDETPPDLHYSAGMVCVDCHVGRDVHGDGRLYSTAKYQKAIKCEDCHGTVRAEIEEADDGYFYGSGGQKLKQLRRADDGGIVLITKGVQPQFPSQLELRVTQIKKVLDSGVNPRMVEAMGVNENGFSHTDSMECFACHTSYRQECFGCHVEMDDRFSQPSHQTGSASLGLVFGRRDTYSLKSFFLGQNRHGKISPVCASSQMFMTYTDENGDTIIDEQTRVTPGGKKGFGWAPNHQHTTARIPQNCDRCHPNEDESNLETVRATYGFGEVDGPTYTDGDGVEHNLTQILDENGDPLVEFGHTGAGAVSKARIEKAMSIHVTPHPR